MNFMERNVVIFFIFYGLDRQSQDLSTDFTPKVCLFGAVMLTKDADQDKYSYSGYGIRFDFRSTFSFWNFDWGKNFVIFIIDNSSSAHIDNKKKIS